MAGKRQPDKYCSEKEAYQNLAIAVVKQAARDYLGVCRRLEKKPGSRARCINLEITAGLEAAGGHLHKDTPR